MLLVLQRKGLDTEALLAAPVAELGFEPRQSDPVAELGFEHR